MNKIALKEIQALREKLTNVESLTMKTMEESEKKENEYNSAVSDYNKMSIHNEKIKNSQNLKIDSLDSKTENFELKIRLLREELSSLETACKDNASELAKLRAELPELKKANQKRITIVKEKLKQAKEDMQEQCELDFELERAHNKELKKAVNEYENKLKNAEKTFLERYKKAELKYNSKVEPLLFRIQCLNDEIRKVEEKIFLKPKELEALKIQNERLKKRYEKASSRFLHESKLIIRSLEDVLKYLEKQPKSVTDDVILGVLIAKANLQWIINRLKYYLSNSSWIKETLEQLLKTCHSITELNKSYNNSSLLNENLWKAEAENLKYGYLYHHDDEFIKPKLDSCQSIDMYMMTGTPEDSDFCIDELISSNCLISEYCWLSEINGGPHSGYKTTHRLLYFQTSVKMKCEVKNPEKFSSVRKIKKKLCQQILLETTALFESPNFSMIRDLFMEQIALCGWEGYEEFARDIWRNQVRSWQNHNGCFGIEMKFKNCTTDEYEKKLFKRKDSVIDDCHTHITGVAIPALAFFLRVTLKMAFNLPEKQNF